MYMVKSIHISLCKNSYYFCIITFFFFKYSLFKIFYIILFILHYISLKLNINFSYFFNWFYFLHNNNNPLYSFILGICMERIKK